MSAEVKSLIVLDNDKISSLTSEISSLTSDKKRLEGENAGMKKNIDTLTQKNAKNLEKLNELTVMNTNLKTKITYFQDEAISSKAKSRSVPSRIGDVILGFVIGFGFTFLIIFIMWFTSLFTESISDVYKEIFCSNKLK